MDRQAEIAQCDEIMIRLTTLFMTVDTNQILDFAKERYKIQGRGFVPIIFNSAGEALDFIKIANKTGDLDLKITYLGVKTAIDLEHATLAELANKYDPENSYVVLFSIDLNSPPKDDMGRMNAVIIKSSIRA